MKQFSEISPNRYKAVEEVRLRLNENSKLMKQVEVHPIGYNVLLARISGKAAYGLFMCQLLYWHKRGHDKEWVYKTQKECWKETQLTRSEQEGAIRVWKELGILEVKRKGIPQKRHFRVDLDKLLVLLIKAKNDEEATDSNAS